MTIGKQIVVGFKGYVKAVELIFTKRFVIYFLVSIGAGLALYWAGSSLFAEWAENFDNSLIEDLGLTGAESGILGFVKDTIEWSVGILIRLIYFIVFVLIGGYLVLIIMIPVFAEMSLKAEVHIWGDSSNIPKPNKHQFAKDVIRGMTISLRNIILQVFISLGVFLWALLPVVGIAAPYYMFFVTAFFFGFSFIDYVNERHQLTIYQSVKFMRKYKWVAIVNGAVYTSFLMIPEYGIYFSAFASMLSIVAASASASEIRMKTENNNIIK